MQKGAPYRPLRDSILFSNYDAVPTNNSIASENARVGREEPSKISEMGRHGSNVELNILRGKNAVASVPARMIDRNQSPDRDSVVTFVNDDGHKSLSEIRFSGKKYVLAIGSESAKAESGDSGK